MRSCIRPAFVVLFFAASLGFAQEKKPLTFEQIFRGAEPRLTAPLPAVIGWADDAHYLITRGRGEGAVIMVEAATGKEEPYRDLARFRSLTDSTFSLNAPESHTEDYAVDVYAKAGDLYVLDTRAQTFRRLTTTPSEEKNPTLSPDARWVAFTRDRDLYALEIASGKETRLTSDGSEVITNGYATWLYYEEILGRASRYRAFWWSPDSRHIAFLRTDESPIPQFPLYNSDGQHGELSTERYPKAGDPNPIVRVGIADVAGGIAWPQGLVPADEYFGAPFWNPEGTTLYLQWMNRAQDTLRLLGMDPKSGAITKVYEETQSSWVSWIEDPVVLHHGKGIILATDKDGWKHLYWYDTDGRLRHRLTEGAWTVEAIKRVDEEQEVVYFTASKENSTRTDLYRVEFNGKGLRRLTFGEFNHAVEISPGGKAFVTTYSNHTTPSRIAVCDGDGKILREVGNSALPALQEYALATTELLRVNTSDGFALPVLVTYPIGFDPHGQYPVLISVYGGPESEGVVDRWGGLNAQWLAREGILQVSIDHRGSGHFGKKGAAMMHRCLGKWEISDYTEVVRWMIAQGWVDPTRVCITGGSYGGYVTCMALTAGAGVFTHGVGEFPVTDWSLYDSHYTERYMDRPSENPDGYRKGSVMTYVPQYKGLLYVIHGTTDDNVHFQNSLQLLSAMEDQGKHVLFLAYPNSRHGWGGPKAMHLRTELYRFYYEQLLRKPFPADLFAPASRP